MQKTNKLSDSYNKGDKCHDPTSSSSPGGHLPWVRWKWRRKVQFFQEERAANAKTGHVRTKIHFQTCKSFLCSRSTKFKQTSGPKWDWRGKKIRRSCGHDIGPSLSPKSQGEWIGVSAEVWPGPLWSEQKISVRPAWRRDEPGKDSGSRKAFWIVA